MSIDERLEKLAEIASARKRGDITVRKGDIYYVSKNQYTANNNLGMYNDKPMVIISSDEMCEQAITENGYVLALNLSSARTEETPTIVKITSSGRECVCFCSRIYSINVTRLGTFVGELTASEMAAVDDALMIAMGLGRGDSLEQRIGEKVVEIFRMAVGGKR